MSNAIQGILPVVHMPFREDFAVDYEVLQAEVDHVYACGADGIVLALASELLRLTDEERRQVAAFLVKANRDRGSVTISVGAESTCAAVAFARHAESIGASALMAIPPLSVAVPPGQLRTYFRAILEAVKVPLVLQDASAYVGQPMSVEFQASFFTEFGDRVMFKPEASPVGPVISALNAATHRRARIFEGSGGLYLAETYRRGLAGTMPGVDLLDAIVALWRALESNDEDRVDTISPLLAAILAMAVGLDGYIAIEKHLMARRGIFRNTLARGPVGFELDESTTREIDRLFDRLQAVLGR